MGEFQSIPSAPRSVRRAAYLRHRWVLGVIGLALLVPSSLVTLIFVILGIDLLPLKDDALDAEAAIAPGTVIAVSDSGIHSGAQRFDRVRFRFDVADGERHQGASFATSGSFVADAACEVEFLVHDPAVARIRGTRRNPIGALWSVLIGAALLPACMLCLVWLRGAMSLKLLLATGGVALARITGSRRVAGVNPPQWRVDYEFEDSLGRTASGSHWIGRRSPLGRRLETDPATAPVVFDDGEPTRSRLVHEEDFAT